MEDETLDESVGVSAHAGFPNAATDNSLSSLNLHQLLIKRPLSTFFMRLHGNDWQRRGIYDNDLIIVDRALVARPTDLVIWWQADNFMVSTPAQVPAATPTWGVVTSIIHQLRP